MPAPESYAVSNTTYSNLLDVQKEVNYPDASGGVTENMVESKVTVSPADKSY